jgi:hypothetical protein
MNNINVVCMDFDYNYQLENQSKTQVNVKSTEMFHENKVFFYCYEIKNLIRCSLDDVYTNPNENYYFIFGSWFLSVYWLIVEKKVIPLPQEYLDTIKKCKNFKVMFINGSESEGSNMIDILKEICDRDGYNENQFYIINNNYILDKRKNEIGSKINVHSSRSLSYAHTKCFLKYHVPFVKEKEFLFLSHTRIPKPHRYGIILYFLKNKMIHELDWSITRGFMYKNLEYNINKKINYSYFFGVFNREDVRDYDKEIEYLSTIDIKKSKYEQNVNWFDLKPNGDPVNYDWGNQFVVDTFINSYINITTESCFDRPFTIHITEKSFKPFYFLQIPIIVGTQGHIASMRERYDFDFFDDLIDHSYDNEKSNIKRFEMILQEIKKLYDNKQHVIDFYGRNEKRLLENQKKMLKIMTDDTDIKFIKGLTEWKEN